MRFKSTAATRCCVISTVLFLGIGVSNLPGADEAKPAKSAQGVVHKALDKSDEAWQRLIYVPYRAIKNVLNDPQATAIVPLQEYLRLWNRAMSGVHHGVIPAVVTQSHYSVKVEKDVAQIQASLTVESLEKNWSEAIVNFGGAAIGKITSEKNRVLVRGLGQGGYALLVPTAGSYKINLDLTTPVRTSPDGRSLELDCPSVGITSFELSIPEADAAVELTPQAVFQPVEAEKGYTHIRANLPSSPRIIARWHPRVSTKPEMELLSGVENVLHVTIGDGVVRTDAALTYKVFRGALGQLRLAVPLGDRILDVSSPQGAIRSWKAVNEPNRQLVIVDLLSNVSRATTVEVHTERPLPPDGFDVAGVNEQGHVFGIHAVDVTRESGELILSHREGIDVVVESEKGLIRVEAGDVPTAYRKPNSTFYKFYSPAIRLRVEARPVEPQIVLGHQAQLVFSDDEVRLTANLHYDVKRAGIFELRLKVPEGLTIDSVECSLMKDYHYDAGAHNLLVTLNEKQQGAIAVVVKAHRDLGKVTEIDLPLLEPVGVFREDGLVEAFAPEGIDLASDDSKLAGAHPEPAANTAAPPNTQRAGTWSFHQRPVVIRVKMSRKPTRLSARIGTTISLQQESAAVNARIDFNVENAGIDTFRIAVPEAVANQVQIQAENGQPGVKQQSRDEKAVDGRVVWTIVLQQKVTGRHRFVVKYDLKPVAAAAKAAAAPKAAEQKRGESAETEFLVNLPLALGLINADGSDRVALAQIEGEAAVLKDRALSVAATASGGDVEAIDVRELKQLDKNAYLAYRYEKQPVQLKLSLVKYGVQEVVETVVSRALIEVVVGRDASALYRCRYRIKTSQRQRLPIELPNGSSPLGVFLDGKQVPLETNPAAAKPDGWTGYFVNIVRPKASDEPLILAIQFRRTLSPPPFESQGGPLKLAFPKIGGPAGDHVVVQQLKTAVWIPEKYVLVQTPRDYQAEFRTRIFGQVPVDATNADLDNWIGGNGGGLFEFPKEGKAYIYGRLGPADSIVVTWVNVAIYTFVISFAIAIVAWLLRRSRWETLATIVLAGLLSAALIALLDREMVWHVLIAARYGLAALVAIWLIEAFRRWSKPHPTSGKGFSASSAIPPGVVVPPPGIFDTLVAKGE